MSSLLCAKSLRGSIQIHDPDVAEQMLSTESESNFKNKYVPRYRSKKKEGRQPVSSAALEGFSDGQSGVFDNGSTRNSNWLSSQQMKDMQDRSMKEGEMIRGLCSPLLKMEQTLVKDVDEYLSHANLMELRKKELLHKTWNSQVYEPIRCKILDSVNGKQFSESDRRRRELYRQYLEFVNKKGHVFLDTMDKGEYYSQALNSHRPAPITVHTASLRDPLLSQGRERNREEQTILRCMTGEIYSLSDIDQIKLPPLPLVPLGRHNTSSITWLEMPLGNIESTPRKASRLRMKGNCTQSQIDFGQWSKLPHDAHTFDQEMNVQKKRRFVNTPPFDQPPRPFNKLPYACYPATPADVKPICPVSS